MTAKLLAASNSDVEAIIVAVVATVILLALLVVLWSLAKAMRSLREAADDMRREGIAVLEEMRGTVGQANAELERVDGLLGTAESISATVDSASRLAYLTFSNPVIKMLAFGTGTARAARRFRRRSNE
ncbi:MAG TPA: hypothetical protein VF942_14115 [Acidimicrobiales bacterium]|jgi:hypothetical protein